VKLSIVTVNYRSWGHLDAALLALADDFPEDWEMIVVDNESIAEDLQEFSARFPWVPSSRIRTIPASGTATISVRRRRAVIDCCS